ncbi:MAG: 2-oxoacid:acceptor oxidoreductase subunit alpha [Deltaproteobacteria bacterium]|nr:MAG: 2-oxoacid:acceptor oxidoreductase subunit alpha [Deltaproteobacteria bacterium]
MSAQSIDHVVIRFAGDSGDGMQLLGQQFTHAAALDGNDHATLPDFPAEIRAPAGTRGGVSGFQIQFASEVIHTPGDECDVLVAMNPAALVKNLDDLKPGGLAIVNVDRFEAIDLKKAELASNPLTDDSLANFRVFEAPISTLTTGAVEPFGLNRKQADRCKNFFALGMMFWLYSKSMDPTRHAIERRFGSPFREANLAALEAGWSYADTRELHPLPFEVPQVPHIPDARYRTVTGNQALATGLVIAAQAVDRTLFYGSYPITPASDVLHALSVFKEYGVVTFQAEDEIAAVCAAIGASYGGAVGVTGTSGPGLALKSEAINLAIMAELPLVVLNVQRAGPSTGMPTKTEQADLLQAMYGRNGDSPMVLLAPRTPADAFRTAYEAVRIAIHSMVPVMVLSDSYIANGAEPWRIPDLDNLPPIAPPPPPSPQAFAPYSRDPESLARPWIAAGTPGYAHRIGGLEKQDVTGTVSYIPKNHQRMTELRAQKVQRAQALLQPAEAKGDPSGTLLIGWGSTYGAIKTAVARGRAQGHALAHLHLRALNPFPPGLAEVLSRYDRILVPELNSGQLCQLLRAHFLVDAVPLSKVQGQPFKVREIHAAVELLLQGEPPEGALA